MGQIKPVKKIDISNGHLHSDDLSVFHFNDPIGTSGKFGIVCYDFPFFFGFISVDGGTGFTFFNS